MTPTRHADEQRLVGLHRAGAGRHGCLSGQRSGQAEARKISGANRPISITIPPTALYQSVFVVRPANAEPLLIGHRRERVHDLGQAVAGRS